MAKTAEKPPIKYYEIVDRKGSGFIMNGTEGTQFQQELSAPSVQWISATGKAHDPNNKHGFVDIRWISGCNFIDPQEQERQGYKPNRFEDKIPMESGYAAIERSGNTVGLYDYYERVFYNTDVEGRPATAAARFREVKINKKAELLLDEDEMLTQAKALVYELRLNTGNKETPYRYNEDRINAICRLVNVWDESNETKLVKLIKVATQNPKEFIETVLKAEQTVITEVSHALELKVIMFDGNTAQYCNENKIIHSLGSGNMKPDVKIERLAAWLSTSEGNESLTELRAKIELAKEQLLK